MPVGGLEAAAPTPLPGLPLWAAALHICRVGSGLVNAAVPLQAPKPWLTPSKAPSATAQLLSKYP